MEALAGFSGLVGLFLVIAAVMALLLIFFVFRIRNEMIKLNQNMSKLIALLGGEDGSRGDVICSFAGGRSPFQAQNNLKETCYVLFVGAKQPKILANGTQRQIDNE